MATVPLKPQYGPTLGRLIATRFRVTPARRAAAVAAGVALLALLVAVVPTLLPARISHGGRVPFSFSYKDLYKTTPEEGGYARVERHRADGRLEDSFAVDPLVLPPYAGSLSAELPLYAAGYIHGLSSRYAGFVLRQEGKTRVDTVPGYNIIFSATVAGQAMYGRDVLLLPERPGVRDGVVIAMLTTPTANSQVTSPLEVAGEGVLKRPLQTFSFG